ncbi:recombinase family protein [Bacillus aerolatus]|uniref:Recombinase family protein n=1 Tax=Bacillus aerolatus TaxID=2653354 RepID=A0A6I1FCI1_9BACI|nr:recombinase family protein [Bacillus aerolatus]KAB7704911.1 recombinase family protein [Bacillus aerolatus]
MYVRNSISKEKQKLSIEMQKDHVNKLAQKENLLIDDIYSDDETSARKTKVKERTQMSRMLREIRKGEIKTVLVYSRCRFARNVHDYMEIYRTFKEHSIKVFFATEHEFPMLFTIEGELIERIMAAFNEHEAENLVKKLKDAKLTKARQGKHAAGKISFGYEQSAEEDGDWTIIKEEAQVVQDIFNLFTVTRLDSLNQFVEMVNQQGLTYKDDKPWTYGNIRNLLKNPIYKGIRKYQDIKVPVLHLQIVEEQVWKEAQVKLSTFTRDSFKEEEKEKPFFLLDGMIQCMECEEVLISNKAQMRGKKIEVYRCKNHSKIKFEKEKIEKEVMLQANNFFNEILSPFFKEHLKKMAEKDTKIFKDIGKMIENVRSNLKDEIGNRLDVLLNIDKVSDVSPSMMKLYEELQEVTKSHETFKEKWFESIETLKELEAYHDRYDDGSTVILHEDLNGETARDLLQNVVKGIYVHSDKEVSIIFKHPYLEGVGGREIIGLK